MWQNTIELSLRVISLLHYNVRSVDLVSREWCDLVFEGRNRSYGAYRLRQEAGRRYARALWGILLGLLFIVASMGGINTYLSLSANRELAQLLAEMHRMNALQRQDAHLLRFVDTRPQPKVVEKKVAVRVPEIVDTINDEIIDNYQTKKGPVSAIKKGRRTRLP